MTVRRWIADEVRGDRAALTGDHANHLRRVLRARVGQEFDIATPDSVRRGRIVEIREGRVEFELSAAVAAAPLAPLALAISIFKFDRMEWAIEKCTELGVARILPIVASRSDAHLASAAARRRERWLKIARQASEQSRRAQSPEVEEVRQAADIMSLPFQSRILLSETEDRLSLREALAGRKAGGDLILAVGPEGGWTEDEQGRFRNAGWIAASLGTTILRAETAAIAAVAVAVSALP